MRGETVEAKAHDIGVLPHHYDEADIEDMFPRVHADEYEDEFPDYEAAQEFYIPSR